MKITLIRTPSVLSASEIRPGSSPPLGLAYLASSLIHAGHEVAVVDAVGERLSGYTSIQGLPGLLWLGLSVEEIVERTPADSGLFAVTCMFSTEWPIAKRVIQALRDRYPRTPIIAGGEHITACPEFVLEDCPALDYCGLGEGERLIVDVANAVQNRSDLRTVPGLVFRDGEKTVINPERERVTDIDSLPEPAWNYFPIREYIDHGAMPGVNLGRSIPILASRGCPYECTFCSNPMMWGRLWKPRAPEQVFAEMKRRIAEYKVSNFDFYDLTAIVRKDWIIKMSRLIIDSGISLTWQLPSGTRSEAIDAEVSGLLYQSGCRNMIYAPESGSEITLTRIKKKINKKAMVQSIRGAVRSGIKTKANFIVGFPDEKLSHVFESYLYCARLAVAGLHDVSFFPFSPYPGSELFDLLKSRGQLPRMNDEYFFSLVTNRRSYSEHIPSGWLPVLTTLGMLLFYSVSFSLRPWRLLSLLKAMATNRPQTRLESALLRVVKHVQRNFQATAKTT
ncbi:MAG: cobalamin B12-binding domain-containing protein [Candidatus Omnitrophica bacterium]|nr:cobalamin B12-binding domain-containing protein [Candidatus Omnitrophota bacterium]